MELVALGAQAPQNNAMGAFQQGQQHALGMQQGQQNMQKGAMEIDNAKKAQAEHVLQLVGTASMHALGGNINGTPDPQKFEQGLDMLESQGFDVKAFRGKPEMAAVAAKASMTAFQQLSLAKSDRDFEMTMQKFEADMAQNKQQAGFDQQRIDLQKQGLEQGRMQPGYRQTENGNMEAIPGGPADPNNPLNAQKAAGSDLPSGYRMGANGNMEAVPGGPADPNNPLNTRKVTAPLTPTDKKAIFAAEDEIPVLDNTIASLSRAIELNDAATEGFLANSRARAGSQLPKDYRPDAATAGREYLDIMTGEAATQMSSVLKGATTDKELGIFMDIISDLSKPREVRKRALDRMIKLAADFKNTKVRRIAELKGTEEESSSPENTSPVEGGNMAARDAPRASLTPKEQWDALPSGSVMTFGGKRYKKP